MGHLDKRMDPDKDPASGQDGRIKDGVSGNPPESTTYQQNKTEDLPDGPAPDVVEQKAPTDSRRKG